MQSYIEPKDDANESGDERDVSEDTSPTTPAVVSPASQPNSCKKCKRVFKTPYLHKRHAQQCLTSSAYQCTFCDARFVRDEHLQAHMSLLHAIDVWEQMKERLSVFLDM